MRRPCNRLALLLGCCVLLSGCYRLAANVSEAHVAQPGMALMLASVTQTSDGVPTPFDHVASFYFSRADGGHRFRLQSAEIDRPVLGPKNRALADAGLEAVHGKLYAVQLPPGVYRLDHFRIDQPGHDGLRFAVPVEVSLAGGDAVYIGNLDAAFCIRHIYANQYGVAGIRLSVSDRSARDVPLLRARFATLRNASIGVRTIDDARVQEQAAGLARPCACRKNC